MSLILKCELDLDLREESEDRSRSSRGMGMINDKWLDSYTENNIQNHFLYEEMQRQNAE